MSLTGEEVASAFRKWLDAEVAGIASAKTDLGKFFFGVSTGTVALFVSLEKIGLRSEPDRWILVSLAVLLASMIAALLLVMPSVWRINSSTDMFDEHAGQVRRVVALTQTWFGLWGVAVGIWVYRLFWPGR